MHTDSNTAASRCTSMAGQLGKCRGKAFMRILCTRLLGGRGSRMQSLYSYFQESVYFKNFSLSQELKSVLKNIVTCDSKPTSPFLCVFVLWFQGSTPMNSPDWPRHHIHLPLLSESWFQTFSTIPGYASLPKALKNVKILSFCSERRGWYLCLATACGNRSNALRSQEFSVFCTFDLG